MAKVGNVVEAALVEAIRSGEGDPADLVAECLAAIAGIAAERIGPARSSELFGTIGRALSSLSSWPTTKGH